MLIEDKSLDQLTPPPPLQPLAFLTPKLQCQFLIEITWKERPVRS